MKTLFLASYFAGVENLFDQFLQQYALPKKVLFIPTAGNVESYVEYIEEAKNIFQKFGFDTDIVDIVNTPENVIKDKLAHTPYLYISGGNTFYLLQELKRKHLLPSIKSQIADGMIYIGESAGAIITSQDIEYNQIMDDKNVADDLNDYSALNLVNFAIVPHYGEFPFEESTIETVQTYQSKLKLLPITNSQAIIVNEDDYVVKNDS
ncbi:Type 1 glutamine amidotransferase-like domain-containing protein [Aggregatibacter actinomycetemcomitans]|uniref:Type 1 glutamine amidotransferase-like domain-containing protein n=1 Tax=Aggregatibacter actinomycetemcomitans TaxID=714 RepID=UPI00197C6616|nr:Type 1 glutamine amidotransferase-like domain-containing protein [Aggregatibacter actinomycetemcomitans]MBN6063082.1 Type 1 glutamine amidotransferase-like domain-containing protein [Aggregatibacter actinomycetemcomitans]MBN6082347.1 Type 1 glutamine amidotransferase-like domain-containing protein [Aggregatibacter actinomycetemcomitans]MBN6082977.1 Type 1 glutamine amidotransferase-like domain-containing protein [Aggregatibacter actinomycetemcomitans]